MYEQDAHGVLEKEVGGSTVLAAAAKAVATPLCHKAIDSSR
jgi:hypothetical protein